MWKEENASRYSSQRCSPCSLSLFTSFGWTDSQLSLLIASQGQVSTRHRSASVPERVIHVSSASSTSCSSSERRVLDERVVGFPSLADDEKVFFVDEEGMRRGEGSEPEAMETSGEFWRDREVKVRSRRASEESQSRVRLPRSKFYYGRTRTYDSDLWKKRVLASPSSDQTLWELARWLRSQLHNL